MNDKMFVDTNVWVYLYSDDNKSKIAKTIISSNFENIIISTQVLNEFFNVISHKNKIKSKQEAKVIINDLSENFLVSVISTSTILHAIDISIDYQLGFFDSLMLSSAIEENCPVFYSEDLHSGLVVGNSLTVKNPFE